MWSYWKLNKAYYISKKILFLYTLKCYYIVHKNVTDIKFLFIKKNSSLKKKKKHQVLK